MARNIKFYNLIYVDLSRVNTIVYSLVVHVPVDVNHL